MEREKRSLLVRDLEVREAPEGAPGFWVRGHALTFDDPYPVWDFEEQWHRDAVADDIQEQDVFAFWSHDSAVPLARTRNGTLSLTKDDIGLGVEFVLPESRAAEAEAIRTGLVDKMSVGFIVQTETWDLERGEATPDLRTITAAKILEVSPVAMPANPNTDISEREVRAALEAREALQRDVDRRAKEERRVMEIARMKLELLERESRRI